MRSTSTRRGFTMVEMIFVIAIIALLLGILLPALSGMQKRGRKMVELNNLRQVGVAWTMYANGNKDAALPGWLEPGTTSDNSVQTNWRVRYEYPVAPDSSPQDRIIPQEIAAPWTWRLMPYLDFNYEMVWGYRGEPMRDLYTLVEEAEAVAFEPAFGYNGYYIGGWWEVVQFGGDASEVNRRPVPKFHSATADGKPVNVVARSVPQITRTDQVIVFCGAATVNKGSHRRISDLERGSHIITPPMLASTRQWRLGSRDGGGPDQDRDDGIVMGRDPNTIIAAREPTTAVPAPRYNRQVAVSYADGSTLTVALTSLEDPRVWINAALDRNFSHTE